MPQTATMAPPALCATSSEHVVVRRHQPVSHREKKRQEGVSSHQAWQPRAGSKSRNSALSAQNLVPYETAKTHCAGRIDDEGCGGMGKGSRSSGIEGGGDIGG